LSDTTQGQDIVQDADLFSEATSAETLEKFENPDLPVARVEPKTEPKTEPKGESHAPQEPDGPIPAGRLREESENRRRAERERDDLRARLAAYEVQPRQQQQPGPKPDIFDNPQVFVENVMKPYLDRMEQREQMRVENASAEGAVRLYGEDRVGAARAALEQGMARHDPTAWATYNRAMGSHDPYGVITRAHLDRETLQQIGGDLDGYKKRVLEEALKDPEFHRRAIEAAKGQATQQVNRPAVIQSNVPNLPSLSNIGAAGGDEQMQEPTDEALFRAAVSAKRRK
jgi:hypothetical protein